MSSSIDSDDDRLTNSCRSCVTTPHTSRRKLDFAGVEEELAPPLKLTRRLVIKQAALVVEKPAKKAAPCVLSVRSLP